VGSVPFSKCWTGQGYSEGWIPATPPPPCSPAWPSCLADPCRGLGSPWGWGGEVRERGKQEGSIPLLPAWRTIELGSRRRNVLLLPCHLATTGTQASTSWPLALHACWQAASAGRGGREGQREMVPGPTWMAGFWQACWAFSPSSLPLFVPSVWPWCISGPAVPLGALPSAQASLRRGNS